MCESGGGISWVDAEDGANEICHHIFGARTHGHGSFEGYTTCVAAGDYIKRSSAFI